MPESRSDRLIWKVLLAVPFITLVALLVRLLASDQPTQLDPAAWGSDHIGQPIPEYVTGEQCLFCHREKIGPGWAKNRHNLTIRDAEASSPGMRALEESAAKTQAGEVKYVMGHQQAQRFLKPSSEYGKAELLSVKWTPSQDKQPGKLEAMDHPHWEGKLFGASCAGCHTTAVDTKTQAFSSLSLDCYTCHGNVPVDHPNKPELAYLSQKKKDTAALITSICAQCHVRSGQSKSTGLPYPNTFVAGDNLFRDFKTDFSDASLKNLSAADRHVMENVRDVVIRGNGSVTCLSCHDVHGQSSKKHRQLSRTEYCQNCHNATGPMIDVKPFTHHNKTCGY